jgi:uncharacterized RDD family membrane protein YckC
MYDPYAPPRTYDADVAVSSHAGLQNASLERRFAGALIDGVLLTVVGTILSVVSAAIVGAERTVAWALVSMLVPQCLQWYLIATRGQSVGKILVKTRIALADGSAPGFFQGVVLRTWVFLLPGLCVGLMPLANKDAVGHLPTLLAMIDVAFIFSPGARCFHDRVAGTRVVAA